MMTNRDPWPSIQPARDAARPGREGLDETRRLLYMALLRSRTEKYELAGTLVNALAHHHPDPDGASAEEIADHVIEVIEGGEEIHRTWLLGQISRMTRKLEAVS